MVKRLFTFLLLGVCLCVFTTSCARKPEIVDLKLKLEKGKIYTTTAQMEQKIEQTIVGRKQDMDQNMKMKISYFVEDVNSEGQRTLKMTYDAIRFEQKSPVGTNVYDSEKEEVDKGIFGQMFAPMVGQAITMKILENGQVTSVKGFKKIIEDIVRNIPAKTEQQKKMVKQMISQQQKSFAGKDTFEQMFKIYPAGPVKVGDSWESVITMKGNFPLKIKNVYTLKDVRVKRAIIDVKTEIVSAEGMQKFPGMEQGIMNIDLKGQGHGEMHVNIKSGWIMRSDMEQDISGEIRMAANEQMPEEMKWPIKMTTKMRMRGK